MIGKLFWGSLLVLLMMTVAKTRAQVFSWALGFSGNDYVDAGPLAIDQSGNVYLVGTFNAHVDFDQGPNMHILSPIGKYNMFLLKLDASGNFLWVKQFPNVATSIGNNSIMGANSIVIDDKEGSLYVSGSYTDSFDFDPGPGALILATPPGNSNGFVLKLDTAGNFIWAKKLDGPTGSNSVINDIGIQKSIYLAVSFGGTIDADPGVTNHNLTSAGSGDILIIKLDKSGGFQWAKQIGGVGTDGLNTLVVDSVSNIFLAGVFMNTVDFDPGSGVFSFTATPSTVIAAYDIFIEKLDSTGNFLWAKQIGGSQTDNATRIGLNPWGDLSVTGSFGGVVDFDPGLGIYNLTANSTRSAFTLKLRNNGDFAWANNTGANVGLFNGAAITTDSVGNVYTGLELPNPCDIDPGPAVATVPAGVAVQKLDSSGNFVWGAGWEGESIASLALDGNNSVYTTGSFAGANKDFDPGPGTFLLSGSSQGSGFIHKMCQGTPPNVPIIASDTVACVGDTITLTAAVLPGAYQWTTNLTTVLPDTTASIKVTNTGVYSVRVSGSCPSIGTTSVSFLPVGNPSISLPPGPVSVTIGQQAVVTASVSNPGSGYTINWYRNGMLFSTTTGSSVSYTKTAGTDTLAAIVFDPGNSCYNPDTSNQLIIDAVNSLEDPLKDAGLVVSPNPSNGLFNFSSGVMIEKIEVTDLTGKRTFQLSPKANRFTINIGESRTGIYFYRATVGEKTVLGTLLLR